EDFLDGGEGNDILSGQANNDEILGNNGSDQLNGGGGNDRLFGQAGNDTLVGGLGNDFLVGGGGFDRFIFGRDSGSDTVSDFTNNVDNIDLRDFGFSGSATFIFNTRIAPNAEQQGSAVVIDLSSGGDQSIIRLGSFQLSNLDATDFSFF
ncbi:MAG: calcium-binding protein, partial [Pseudomonadota bacterium]